MSTLVKVQNKGQVTIPTRLRIQAGIEQGDVMEASFDKGRIVLVPKLLIDRSKFPTADDEYTPAQRKVIDARLAEADEDIKKGLVHGPFGGHKELMVFLHEKKRKAGGRKIQKRSKTR
jgi:AbrB family looped-hinge helix DNA binding protein